MDIDMEDLELHEPHPQEEAQDDFLNIEQFRLVRKIAPTPNQTTRPDGPRSLALFPSSLGKSNHAWKAVYDEFWDAVAIGDMQSMSILFLSGTHRIVRVNLPSSKDKKRVLDSVKVAWTVHPTRLKDPLLIFTHQSLVYVFDVRKRTILATLRGHGGGITSLLVNPLLPHIFCTTSRDFSTRIYDLNLPPKQKPNNPIWPPNRIPSLAGPAHGLDMSEPEGKGELGRCVMVLMGGRSGGHEAEVLSAAFHPQYTEYPLLATCGMDRAVKIWYTLPILKQRTTETPLAREDKPLFSSTMVHKSRVLSIFWLSSDILLSHNAPVLLQKSESQSDTLILEEGCMVIWQWLGLNRFFPAGGFEPDKQGQALRGCASDYQESASFKFITCHSLPLVPAGPDEITPIARQRSAPGLLFSSVWSTEGLRPAALLTYPGQPDVALIDLANLEPRVPAEFKPPEKRADMQAKRPRLEKVDGKEGEIDAEAHYGYVPHPKPPAPIEGFPIAQVPEEDAREDRLMTCAMGFGGLGIVGLGANGTLWLWKSDGHST